MIVEYRVGKEFPHKEYRGVEGGRIKLNRSGFDVVLVLRGVSSKEKKDFVKSKFVYGLAVHESVPFLVVDFPGLFELDASLNIFGFRNESDREFWLKEKANMVTFFLVDGNSFVLKAMKVVGLNLDMIGRLNEVCKEQRSRYRNKADVDQVISQALFANPTIKDFLRKIEKRYKL